MPPALVDKEQIDDIDNNINIEGAFNSISSQLNLGMPLDSDYLSTKRKKLTTQKSDLYYKGLYRGRYKPFNLGVRKPQGPGYYKQK